MPEGQRSAHLARAASYQRGERDRLNPRGLVGKLEETASIRGATEESDHLLLTELQQLGDRSAAVQNAAVVVHLRGTVSILENYKNMQPANAR